MENNLNYCTQSEQSEQSDCSFYVIRSYAHETNAKYGRRLLRMQSYNSTCTENGVYQVTNVLPAGSYTFSVYARALAAFSGSERPGVYIRVTDTSGNILAESEHINGYASEYIRLVAPFELTASRSVSVQILVDGAGIAYIDAAQLENNPFANAYNLLENSNFERDMTGWIATGASTTTGTRFNMSRSLMIPGNLEYECCAYQDVTVKTYAGTRETFTLSGWAKGYGLPTRERENTYFEYTADGNCGS